jgi:hypothetical protein
VDGRLALGHLWEAAGSAELALPKVARGLELYMESCGELWRRHTFADTLQSAHLCAIFHGMQREVDFRERLLVLNGAHGPVEVILVDILLIVLHDGQQTL